MLISVSDSSGELFPYARHYLDAMAFWPDDERSFYQVGTLLDMEYQARRLQGDDNRLSQVLSTQLNFAAKRSQQVWVAGLVALSIFGLHAQGQRVSQEAAYRLVSQHAGRVNRHPFVYFDSNNAAFIEKAVPLQSDHDSIRRIFTRYRCAAHICAARVVATQYLEPLAPFETARTADRCYLLTAIAFQHLFDRQLGFQEWGLRLLSMPPGLNDDAIVFLPTVAQMEDLFGGPLE